MDSSSTPDLTASADDVISVSSRDLQQSSARLHQDLEGLLTARRHALVRMQQH